MASELSAGPIPPNRRADRIGRVLMALMGVTAALVFATSALMLGDVPEDRFIVEGWRAFGFAVFAGIWLILAAWPRRTPGLWELLIVHKSALTVLAFVAWGAPETQEVVFVDLALTVLTVLAYVLCRGWQAWYGITLKKTPGPRQ